MTVIISKNEPLPWQSTLRSYKSKNDVKTSNSKSSTSVKKSRSSASRSQPIPKRIDPSARGAKTDQKEATKCLSSLRWTGSFILMVELRKKIIIFRDIVGLPPLTDNISITNVVMHTIKDLQKLCPCIVKKSLILNIPHLDVDKFLDQFYKILKLIGDSWIDDREWIVKSKYQRGSVGKNQSDRFVENVLAALDGLIKKMKNKLQMMEMCDDQKKKKRNSLSQRLNGGDLSRSESSTPLIQFRDLVELQEFEESLDVNRFENVQVNDQSVKDSIEKMEKVNDIDQSCLQDLKKSEIVPLTLAPPPLPVPVPAPPSVRTVPPPPSPPLPRWSAMWMSKASSETKLGLALQMPNKTPPQQPPQMATTKRVTAPPPPPPPPPPLQPLAQKPNVKGVTAPPPPPPPYVIINNQATKTAKKLKRSNQFGSLYRFLKGKIEGIDKEARIGGLKGEIGNTTMGKNKGMADALAEMIKKSLYFQKIEEDVQKYMKSIHELKIEITKFHNKDITELQNFHCYVESVLDKLTDETQILAKCEGFPHKKLETIRTGVSLYSKVNGMIKELKNWKMESSANQVLDKTEHYFAKMRREIESLDQIKDTEAINFKNQNINFDFSILLQVKETMVDVSSNCMELVLKESRTAKSNMKKKKIGEDLNMLWRAFLLAYKVYTFAGGHDDRADKLATDLADEINLTFRNQSLDN